MADIRLFNLSGKNAKEISISKFKLENENGPENGPGPSKGTGQNLTCPL